MEVLEWLHFPLSYLLSQTPLSLGTILKSPGISQAGASNPTNGASLSTSRQTGRWGFTFKEGRCAGVLCFWGNDQSQKQNAGFAAVGLVHFRRDHSHWRNHHHIHANHKLCGRWEGSPPGIALQPTLADDCPRKIWSSWVSTCCPPPQKSREQPQNMEMGERLKPLFHCTVALI